MTTAADIERQLQAEHQAFFASQFAKELPDDLIERFKKALMASAPGHHKYHSDKVKAIIVKKPYDLNYLDVGMIINLLFAVPFEKLYDSLEEAIEKNLELENIRELYNKIVNETEQRLSKKRGILLNLSGVHQTPMKSIKAEA